MPVADIPDYTDILVIGGGPAGAYAASALAREGFSVTVLEKDVFPRYHIGESMLPSCRPFLRFIGAEEKVAVHGFTVKVGTAVKLNQFKREGYTDFISPDPTRAAWNVVRSEFDEILLRHSAESGARVCEGVQATGINFSAADPTQPVSADWKSNGRTGTTRFAWLVDASGRAGLLSTKYLKNRKFNRALRNVAMWGYWQGAGTYAPGTPRANAPWFEALTNQTGWAWFIPLHNGTVSIGVVLKEEAHRAKKATLEAEGRATSEAHYCAQLALAPGVLRLLGDAEMTGEVRSAGDYSYSASHYAGPHYRIVGDAGAFIDPFFSSGVHLALANALSAASSIAASIRGHCTEQEAIKFHSEKMGTSYTRFLIVVLSVYRQITAQAAPVLSDIDEDNFDRAFEFLLPVIQGAADTDQGMTEQTLQRTLDFCEHALGPTTPEMHVAVATRLPSESTLLAPDAPPLTPAAVALLAGDDDDVRHVLLRANARRAVEGIYDWEADLCGDVEGKGMDGRGRGLSVVLERGSLGLRRGVVQLS